MTNGHGYKYEPQEPLADRTAPCVGTGACDRCQFCARFTSRPRDDKFLAQAPGHGSTCRAYIRLHESW